MSEAGFYLYSRKRKRKKPIYYARFKQADGSWSSPKNTGCTNRDAASNWAQEQIDAGNVDTPAGPDPTLDSWAAGFFGVGGRYDLAKRARGRRLSDAYLYNLGKAYDKRISPRFGRRHLREIRSLELEQFFLELYQSGEVAGSTVNMTLKAVRALFAEAERLEVIRRNPAARVGAFAKNSRERGVLSQEELDKLFSFNALETVWGGQTTPYLLAMMAVGCGLRRGEAIALRPKDFTGTTILVSRSWNDHAGEFTAPKWGSMREVPAPPRIQEELTAYIEAHELEQDALLFPGEDPSRPVHHKPVMQALRDALSAIGISEAEQSRERRFLDFHALRHTYITRLRSGDVPDWQIQRAAGHRSLAMTDHYTHASGSDLHDVAAARILPFSKGA